MSIKLEPGKRYTTRDPSICDYVEITGNRVVGQQVPLTMIDGVIYGGRLDGKIETWYATGNYSIPFEHEIDLVAEYKKPITQAPEESAKEVTGNLHCDHLWVNCSFSENPDDAKWVCRYCGEEF